MLRVALDAILARMRIAVNRARKRLGSAFSCFLLALASSSYADSYDVLAEPDGKDRWLPAVLVVAGYSFQDVGATVRSGDLMGPSFVNSTNPIRPPASGHDLMTTPDVGLGFELMTPTLAGSSWVPRVFHHAIVSGAFGPYRDVAKEGTIEDLAVDPDITNPRDNNVTGQGSRTRVQMDKLVLRAGTGVAWPVEAFGRNLRVRLSLEYVRQVMNVEGAVRRAVCDVSNGAPVPMCGAIGVDNGGGGIDDFREIDLRKDKQKALHGLGPGLELEADAGRLGSIVPSLSIGVQAYRFLGDRDLKFYTQNEYGETARFTFEQEPWAIRAGVGVRFRWIPE